MARALLVLVLCLLAPLGAGCELVADFDRSKIPEPSDGSAPELDGSVVPDGGTDQDAGDDDAG